MFISLFGWQKLQLILGWQCGPPSQLRTAKSPNFSQVQKSKTTIHFSSFPFFSMSYIFSPSDHICFFHLKHSPKNRGSGGGEGPVGGWAGQVERPNCGAAGGSGGRPEPRRKRKKGGTGKIWRTMWDIRVNNGWIMGLFHLFVGHDLMCWLIHSHFVQ